jgi:hypothetical protein
MGWGIGLARGEHSYLVGWVASGDRPQWGPAPGGAGPGGLAEWGPARWGPAQWGPAQWGPACASGRVRIATWLADAFWREIHVATVTVGYRIAELARGLFGPLRNARAVESGYFTCSADSPRATFIIA